MQYPILRFINHSFYVHLDEKGFLTAPRSAVKRGWLADTIVDYNGFRYQVVKVTDKGRAYWSWYDFLLDPIVRIEIEVAPIGNPLSVNEVRNLI
jgi:hypothetical protein